MSPELKNTWTPTVNVLTWFLLVTATLSVLTRLGTKYFIFRKWTFDDGLATASLVFCIAQSIAISMATKNGLGQHLHMLSVLQVESVMKAEYSATFLFIASICFSKLSVLIFIRNLTPAPLDRRFALVLGIFIGLWTITSIFTAAFQCQVPQTWNYVKGTCFDRSAWWRYLGVTNILSEGGIIGQALLVIVRIQTDFSRKASLSSVFLIRIIVIISIILQLVYASETSSGDFTYEAWTVAVSTQVAQCVSIVTACSPQFKPFLDNLQSSGMGLGMMNSHHHGSKYKTYGMSTFKTFRRTADAHSETHELVSALHEGTNQTMVTSAPDEDTESQYSRSNIILETRTWTVTEGLSN
ncbi:initiation factor 2B related protein [Penicillium digitatum]|uniref:Initiation factor 2B related protein n=1 Tax=Penicillium digitatum TaxID=36651 RepID=A0A7T7BLI1_PENDI|nr:initiation factor 2B related protein [Penicillium digitatum]